MRGNTPARGFMTPIKQPALLNWEFAFQSGPSLVPTHYYVLPWQDLGYLQFGYNAHHLVRLDFADHAQGSLIEDFEQLPSRKTLVQGTTFQLKVWQSLRGIKAGDTTTYADIAQSIGHAKAYRAVGSAVGANPLSIIIPCHRVVRSDGNLGGYHWGIARKSRLLALERV